MIEVSIIIINFNTKDLTIACIESILKNENILKFEIIIVDNASTECDACVFKDMFPQIKLIKNSTNSGFAKGNNIGISIATGQYILLLNSDTLLKNNAISLSKKIIESNNKIGVICGMLIGFDNMIQASAGKFPSLKTELYELCRLTKFLSHETKVNLFAGEWADYTKTFECDWVSGAFFFFPKKILSQFPNGKLHEDFFMYFEDVQWCYYIKHKLNLKVIYSPLPKIMHLNGGSDKNKEANNIDKYFSISLPNEYFWLKKQKGILYTKLFYLTKSILHFSLRTSSDFDKSRRFFEVFLKGSIKK